MPAPGRIPALDRGDRQREPSRRGAVPRAIPPAGDGLRRGYRGRFGMYLPPLLERLGLAEVTHDARNNQMRGIPR